MKRVVGDSGSENESHDGALIEEIELDFSSCGHLDEI